MEKKEKSVIIVDMNRTFTMKEGDSIFWQRPIFIEDSVSSIEGSKIQFVHGHNLPQDTLIGLINFKPLVIITDGEDTARYYGSDTLRFTSCSFNYQWHQIIGPNSLSLK